MEIQEIKQKLEDAKSELDLQRAAYQESRVRLHTETALSDRDLSGAFAQFREFVRALLRTDKYNMFLQLLSFPLPTVSLVEKIYIALWNIFNGRNPVYKVQFSSEEHQQDWLEYRSGVLNFPKFWRTTGWQHYKTAHNCIMIVDLPEEQTTERPEPYLYFLPVEKQVMSEFYPSTDKFKWIAFQQPGDRLAVLCNEFYRVFQVKEGTKKDIIGDPILEVPHNLGYCPAKFFVTTSISEKLPTVKKSVLSNWLGKLDKVLFYDTSNEHLQLYGRYPVYTSFEVDCDYENQETGEYCERGFLMGRDGKYIQHGTSGSLRPCPRCSDKDLVGPGSHITVSPPSPQNDNANLRDPVSILTIDTTALEYNNTDIAQRMMEIYAGATGYNGPVINDQAVNEKQILAIMERLEAALKEPQKNFEEAMQWAESTICRLRYDNTFISVSISLGTEHYIMQPSQILDLYNFARTSSFSTSILDLLEDLYFETEYKNNPEQVQRYNILKNLDPFRHLKNSDLDRLLSTGNINQIDYLMKMNFSSLILRFEREYGSILEYGINSDFRFRVDSIKEQLRAYAEELIPVAVQVSE